MASVINTNISSLNAQRNLSTSQTQLATSLQRLSSGLRINSAKDDAAGLAISERFSTQIRGMNVAARNANDGISLAQSAEGAMTEIGNNLQRVRELAVQSRNATNSSSDRAALQAEAAQLKDEIDRVASTTAFNGTKLLDGSFTAQSFQVGANQGETIDIASITNASSTALGSWTSVATAATVDGIAATGDVAGAAATPGSGAFAAATLVGVDFTTETVSFDVTDGTNTSTITLDGNYADADALTTALTTKLAVDGDFTVANNAGTITITAVATGVGTEVSVGSFNADADGNTTDSSVTAFPTVTGTDGTAAGASTFSAIAAGELSINGVDITVGTATTATGRVDDLVTAINASTAGVTASNVSGVLRLVSDDAADDVVVAGTAASKAGLTAATTPPVAGTAQTGFATLDISTAAGADAAILAMDGALTAINTARANMGAVQNRFSSVVASLQTTSENLSASRSRILDTDFAAETANLTRGQILQQAGTAMLAQANSLPNGVLALLRG